MDLRYDSFSSFCFGFVIFLFLLDALDLVLSAAATASKATELALEEVGSAHDAEHADCDSRASDDIDDVHDVVVIKTIFEIFTAEENNLAIRIRELSALLTIIELVTIRPG